jgi:hypothetical protein
MKPHRLRAGTVAAATLLSAALAGCRALPAAHFYALQTEPPASSGPPATVAPLIRIRHVGVPPEMDHLGLTHRRGATELSISDTDRWSAPLAQLIQGTLTLDLGARLGFEHVVAADALTGSRPDQTGAQGAAAALDLDFVALAADDTCAVTAQVNWTLAAPGSPAQHGTTHLEAAATGCPAGLPGALSDVLGQLADQLTRQLAAP